MNVIRFRDLIFFVYFEENYKLFIYLLYRHHCWYSCWKMKSNKSFRHIFWIRNHCIQNTKGWGKSAIFIYGTFYTFTTRGGTFKISVQNTRTNWKFLFTWRRLGDITYTFGGKADRQRCRWALWKVKKNANPGSVKSASRDIYLAVRWCGVVFGRKPEFVHYKITIRLVEDRRAYVHGSLGILVLFSLALTIRAKIWVSTTYFLVNRMFFFISYMSTFGVYRCWSTRWKKWL